MSPVSAGTMPDMPSVSRHAVIGGAVVLLHVAVLWAMNAGLVRRAVETIVPVQIVSELITPPAPKIAPPPPAPPVAAPPPAPVPAPRPVAKPQPRPPAPAPAPRAVAAPVPAPSVPIAPAATPEPPSPAPQVSVPIPPAPAPAAPAAPAAPVAPSPPRVELPSSDADYLQNPQPPYPPISRRMGEQGQVMLRVLIAADGAAREVEVRRSSGYDRLDRAAVDTVRKWRFVPGKRNGVPEAMWFNVPINFVLE